MIVEYILQVSDGNDEGDEHIELADNLTDSFQVLANNSKA